MGEKSVVTKPNLLNRLNIGIASFIFTIAAVATLLIQLNLENSNSYINNILGTIVLVLLLIGFITSIIAFKNKNRRNIFSKISLVISSFILSVTLFLILLVEVYYHLVSGKW